MAGIFIRHQSVTDKRPDIDIVDVEDRELLDARFTDFFDELFGNFLAGLTIDFAGFCIQQVLSQKPVDQILIGNQKFLHALRGHLVGKPGSDLAARLNDDLACLCVNQVSRCFQASEPIRPERHAPPVLLRFERKRVVKGCQDLLIIKAQRVKQRCCRELAPAVNAYINEVLGIEFEIEPGTAIGNNPRREQQLAG